MTSVFPKQPGYMINHDPTKVDFKRVSSMVLNKIETNDFKYKKDYNLPKTNKLEQIKVRDPNSFSHSQSTFINHFNEGEQISTHFQPDWVKLDKQVLRFYGYFKESVDESRLENSRIRKLRIFYYLVDDTFEISEEKEVNSGLPQGSFLKRQKIPQKTEGGLMNIQNPTYYHFQDLIVGANIDIYGKIITIYDCDINTREFYKGMGYEQSEKFPIPEDNYHIMKNLAKIPNKKDNLMKDYLEHRQGGGKVKNQKQFLENDRRVLKFNASHDSLKYCINYYLADDTVEIKELFFHNSGRIKFPLFLNRNKLPKKFSITQPGEINESDYVTPSDIEVRF